MTTIDLNSQWDNLILNDEGGSKVLRISDECVPDLFLMIDDLDQRGLMISLPENVKLKAQGFDKNKLKFSYIASKGILVIQLKDLDYIDLFDDLILSIYSKISKLTSLKDAAILMTEVVYKWAVFFENNIKPKLNKEQVQGLFGELFFLNLLIEESNSSNINKILHSWRGPFGDPKDFMFDIKCVEVKSKLDSRSFVKISSEFQLDEEAGKSLELFVVSLLIDVEKGKSINDLFNEILEKVKNKEGNTYLFYHALNQIVESTESLSQYNNLRFIVSKTENFDVKEGVFPKLSRSNIDSSINNLRYDLEITDLNEFLIHKKIY
tara:strand:- start:1842 stop:2807 length:966 start_codon:yes stop_codon:yes gene_type:complete